jgi:hypothetical protein
MAFTAALNPERLITATLSLLPEVVAIQAGENNCPSLVLSEKGLKQFEVFAQHYGEGSTNLLSHFLVRQFNTIQRDAADLFVEEVW